MGAILRTIDAALFPAVKGIARAEGAYARANGRWYPLAHPLGAGDPSDTLTLLPIVVGEQPLSTTRGSVERTVWMVPHCTYEGLRFTLRRIWDEREQIILSGVPFDHPGYRGVLWAEGEDWHKAAQLPGAIVQEPRSSMGGAIVVVPLSDIGDYREEVTRPMSPSGDEGIRGTTP